MTSLLDAAPLGILANPCPSHEIVSFSAWATESIVT